MSESLIQIGILGCAGIARKLSRAITLSPNATIAAIGSRSLDKAKKYALENNYPSSTKIYGTYESVLDDQDIDAVYIPLPTSLHLKWVTLAAEKKKHVLLEKPVALNTEEFDEIVKVCEVNGVQLMDGTMWMHHPRTEKMREFLDDSDKFGELKSIHSVFTFGANSEFLNSNIRVKPDLDALGALGDAGWYCTRSILWATNYELPKTATALRGPIFNNSGVLLACGASLQWEDGKVATFHCSFLSNLTMDITAIGSMGTLHVKDFVIPYEEKSAGFTTGSKTGFTEFVTGWEPLPSDHVVATELSQEVRMVKEFARLVKSIKEDGAKPESKWPAISRKTQQVLDAVKASIENGFQPIEIVN